MDLNTITLSRGSHARRDVGVCLMEAVAWMAGEPHSDRPSCADPVLAAFGRSLNDRLRDDERQQLRPLIPLLVGTAGSPALSLRRAYHLVDRHVRYVVPAFLRELPCPRPDIAERLEALPPVIDEASAKRARVLAREIRDQLDAAYYVANANANAAAAAVADAAAAAAYYAAYYAADYAADAYAAAAVAYADDFRKLRAATIARSIEVFREAASMTEAA